MSDFETEIIIARDRGIQQLLGEIMCDPNRYHSQEFDWCIEQRQELNDRIHKLDLSYIILKARQAVYDQAA